MADIGALANQYADLQFNPQQSAIDRRMQLIGQRTDIQNQAVGRQGELGRGYVGEAYNVLDQHLGQNKTNAMRDLEVAGNQVGQGYRDANALGETLRVQSRNALAELAQRMNAGNYAMPILGGIEQTANELQQANANRDATVTGNLRNWAAQSGDIYNRQIGTGHQMRADALSRLESDLIRAIGENNLSGAEQQSDLSDDLVKLLGERGAFLAQQINQLGQQEFEKSVQQAQLDMQAQELNARMADSAADRALRERGMGLEEARFAKEGEMTDKEKLQLQMQAWGMTNEQTNADRGYGLDVQRLLASQEMTPSDKLGVLEYLTMPDANKDLLYEFGLLQRPESGGSAQVGGNSIGRTSGGGGLSQAAQRRSLTSAWSSRQPQSTRPPNTLAKSGALPYTVYPSAGGMRFGS